MARRLSWFPWGRGALPVLLGVFLLVRVTEAMGVLPWWGRGYLDDFLCLPLVLTATLVVHRLAGAGPAWRLPLSHGLLAVGFYGLVFEYMLPRLGTASVADPLDVGMYTLGLAFFHVLINRPGCGSHDSCRSSGLEITDESAAIIT